MIEINTYLSKTFSSLDQDFDAQDRSEICHHIYNMLEVCFGSKSPILSYRCDPVAVVSVQ